MLTNSLRSRFPNRLNHVQNDFGRHKTVCLKTNCFSNTSLYLMDFAKLPGVGYSVIDIQM